MLQKLSVYNLSVKNEFSMISMNSILFNSNIFTLKIALNNEMFT